LRTVTKEHFAAVGDLAATNDGLVRDTGDEKLVSGDETKVES
jgi:hypothetical protein